MPTLELTREQARELIELGHHAEWIEWLTENERDQLRALARELEDLGVAP
jgi:hypothetical protein